MKTDAKSLSSLLEEKGVSCEILKDTTLMVSGGLGKILPLVNDGLFYVQGLSSQRAVEVLEAKSGDVVVDVCACPGGKTVGAAIDMKNHGEIFAFDIHENKLPLINKNAENLGISIIKTEKHNSKNINEKYVGIADKVICDVPCSGIGSIGKRPEIRYKSISDINGLVKTQKEILSSSVNYLKNDGILVYSVCSINKNEGEYLVKAFLEENKNYCLLHEETVLPSSGNDGFYIGKICKKAVK
jgi:16S rRNA (cytosine967-C5)-methyltransferase